MITKATRELYKNGQNMSEHRTEIDLDYAHRINKGYMFKAN